MLKHFAFCYDNKCSVYKEVKYGASYWPQKPKSKKLRGTKEVDRLWESDKVFTVIFNLETAKKLMM